MHISPPPRPPSGEPRAGPHLAHHSRLLTPTVRASSALRRQQGMSPSRLGPTRQAVALTELRRTHLAFRTRPADRSERRVDNHDQGHETALPTSHAGPGAG
ncbi:hypothetical protein LXA43DRAFT_945461 [Ganoderma leucocontextum]|nr:hypothetical protein LXA43DRAFT_945461 [Ganoderma leucocontextum]